MTVEPVSRLTLIIIFSVDDVCTVAIIILYVSYIILIAFYNIILHNIYVYTLFCLGIRKKNRSAVW